MKEPSIDLRSVLLLIGAAQAVFFSLILTGIRKRNRVANLFLACLLFIHSISLIEGFMSVTYFFLKYPQLIGVEWPLTFMYGPLVYFYVKSLTRPESGDKKWKLLVHFLPTILMYAYMIPVFRLNPETKGKFWYLENSPIRNSSPIIDPIAIVAIMQITGYLLLSLLLLRAHSRNIRKNYSSIENINLSWLRALIIIFFCLLTTYAFFTVFSQFYGLYKESEYLLYLMMTIVIYVMGYRGIRQAEIFTAPVSSDAVEAAQQADTLNDIVIRQQANAEMEQTFKYAKSSLGDQQAETILSQLTQLMENEKPYLEMGLTLPLLAKKLDVSPNHLSQVINGKLNKSFFDFVNRYRVEEAKRALSSQEADKFSILGIAMDAGFNSKSSFYTAFKKHTGVTPSQFKDSLRLQDHPARQ